MNTLIAWLPNKVMAGGLGFIAQATMLPTDTGFGERLTAMGILAAMILYFMKKLDAKDAVIQNLLNTLLAQQDQSTQARVLLATTLQNLTNAVDKGK